MNKHLSGEKYDVFLSFKGSDAGEDFADCLFEFLKDAGLRVFMDDEELRFGESIAVGIKKAIYDSTLFVPIFTRKYASSKWCLEEITWMADCMEEFPGKKEMLPVFYNVGASDVKLKTDLYAKALLEHEKTSGRETVERWRNALIKVPKVKGWNQRDAKRQGKFIRQISEHIGHRLELRHKILPNPRIEEQVQDVMNALDGGSSDVHVVVIPEMDGTGKKTLASTFFNKICWQFQGCSFLSNVRESSTGNGIVDLRNKLLGQMLRFSSSNFHTVNDAMSSIKGVMPTKDVVVARDDVADTDQMRKLIGLGDWAGEGSRVIITTRNLSCPANVEEIENNVAILQSKKIYSTAAQLVAVEKCREKYDVFLSFRGADTREGFADCLFEFLKEARISVFMDDEELHVGESIVGGIQEAIYASKLFVPVFSGRYASSKWCLNEMAWMVDCMEEFPGKKEMLPIYYDVDASDVNLKTDLYSKALLEHEKTSGRETVERWEKALIKAPEVKGWNRAGAKGQGKFIKQISQHISCRIELKHRILPDHFIGIEEQVQNVMDVLDCGSNDVRIVVIPGMGGIGKTTLASAVFNKICWQFQGCSFLSIVSELATRNDIINLQDKLLQDLFLFPPYDFGDEYDAMNYIRESLQNKDVLIVLDDVSDKYQIRKLIGNGDWVGVGSRVIITTRDYSIADFVEIEDNAAILQGKKIYVYQMRELDFNNSLQLLCRHAFSQYAPPNGYEQLSLEILSFTRGIPLALEVIGSFLKGKPLKKWKYILKKLKKVPYYRRYREILMTSCKALCDEKKEIFFDIAFFFTGHDKKTVSTYWEACNLFPEISIEILVSYALVKIDALDRFWMHDIFKYFGREVVHKRSIRNLERFSRLCNKDAKALLLRRKGMEYIKALKLDSNHAHNFTPVQLSRLSGLRLLELCGGNFIGDFDGCLSELRWLSWKDCPQNFLGTNFFFGNLVVLRLSRSNVTDTWSGWEQFKTARNLKVLELQGLNLITTLVLASFLSLERLEVRQCRSLQVDPSIGNLQSLNSLVMINPRWRPKGISPDESRRKLLHLPSSICNLKSLTRLVIEGFRMKQLPESIGELKGLKIMEITGCESLRNLPNSIGDLNSLRKLCLEGDGITELPESIGMLRNLTQLNVSNNQLRRLPVTIGDLDRLEMLDASHNNDLQGELPGEFSKLQSLKFVNLSGTGICGLP